MTRARKLCPPPRRVGAIAGWTAILAVLVGTVGCTASSYYTAADRAALREPQGESGDVADRRTAAPEPQPPPLPPSPPRADKVVVIKSERELRLSQIALEEGPAAIRGSARLAWGRERPEGPWLETDLELSQAPVDDYRFLYQLRSTPQALQRWLDQALLAGRIGPTQVTADGPLADFPYPQGRGEFRVRAPVSGLDLRYQRGWLPVREGKGTLAIDRRPESHASSSCIRRP